MGTDIKSMIARFRNNRPTSRQERARQRERGELQELWYINSRGGGASSGRASAPASPTGARRESAADDLRGSRSPLRQSARAQAMRTGLSVSADMSADSLHGSAQWPPAGAREGASSGAPGSSAAAERRWLRPEPPPHGRDFPKPVELRPEYLRRRGAPPSSPPPPLGSVRLSPERAGARAAPFVPRVAARGGRSPVELSSDSDDGGPAPRAPAWGPLLAAPPARYTGSLELRSSFPSRIIRPPRRSPRTTAAAKQAPPGDPQPKKEGAVCNAAAAALNADATAAGVSAELDLVMATLRGATLKGGLGLGLAGDDAGGFGGRAPFADFNGEVGEGAEGEGEWGGVSALRQVGESLDGALGGYLKAARERLEADEADARALKKWQDGERKRLQEELRREAAARLFEASLAAAHGLTHSDAGARPRAAAQRRLCVVAVFGAADSSDSSSSSSSGVSGGGDAAAWRRSWGARLDLDPDLLAIGAPLQTHTLIAAPSRTRGSLSPPRRSSGGGSGGALSGAAAAVAAELARQVSEVTEAVARRVREIEAIERGGGSSSGGGSSGGAGGGSGGGGDGGGSSGGSGGDGRGGVAVADVAAAAAAGNCDAAAGAAADAPAAVPAEPAAEPKSMASAAAAVPPTDEALPEGSDAQSAVTDAVAAAAPLSQTAAASGAAAAAAAVSASATTPKHPEMAAVHFDEDPEDERRRRRSRSRTRLNATVLKGDRAWRERAYGAPPPPLSQVTREITADLEVTLLCVQRRLGDSGAAAAEAAEAAAAAAAAAKKAAAAAAAEARRKALVEQLERATESDATAATAQQRSASAAAAAAPPQRADAQLDAELAARGLWEQWIHAHHPLVGGGARGPPGGALPPAIKAPFGTSPHTCCSGGSHCLAEAAAEAAAAAAAAAAYRPMPYAPAEQGRAEARGEPWGGAAQASAPPAPPPSYLIEHAALSGDAGVRCMDAALRARDDRRRAAAAAAEAAQRERERRRADEHARAVAELYGARPAAAALSGSSSSAAAQRGGEGAPPPPPASVSALEAARRRMGGGGKGAGGGGDPVASGRVALPADPRLRLQELRRLRQHYAAAAAANS
ncbi:hypothetical protein JKP88DRAFT_353112 [Tribonema minus]|uniref:Uncharacterized protein n=1 Tax=Tribonema minus TaxID=303371 RepID=A0A835ZBX6_9STRA|nr:hypothetical protein JKP88DRAFT_353112 [Tribonema minus]